MKDIFQYSSIESYFKGISKELTKKEKRKQVILTRKWAKQFDKLKGVYFIFEKDELKYVGETGSINGRMTDLLNTKNHTLRRSIGERNFSKEKGYQKASSKQSFIPAIETKLNDYIQKNLSVSCTPLEIGRKEFEEWVIESHPEILFYNKRKKRITK
jgi:hypothetical protein